MTRTQTVRTTVVTALAAGAIGLAATAPADAGEIPSGATVSAVTPTVVSARAPISAPAAVSAQPSAPAPNSTASPAGPAAAVSLLDLVPNPLNCLLSTGFAMFCLGLPLS
ncbi:hypothetical protein [Nocardia veterana]|uniref:Uncharacterized protein n=1 Tax=Nocardia veterana TaxID=132249 RepID=A0A7X6RJM7_9NOCA|nr:hypothetical protein [Nocardia veterana]NKY88370.1 hypothetical protein [Nocardia veterana]